MTIIDLVNEVKEMRHWQREFFRLQGQLKKGYVPVTKQLRDEALAKSKEAEAKVDELVAAILDTPHCRECGCTNDMACPGGCFWVEEDLCSACATPEQLERVAQEFKALDKT